LRRSDRGIVVSGADATPDDFTIPPPTDHRFDGVIALDVDATDRWRGIVSVRAHIPVAATGELVLLYPKWLPGFHAPVAPIELLAGLSFTADDAPLAWRRHPTIVHAFAVVVPPGVDTVTAAFQFVSPTDASQGRVVSAPELLCLPWNAVVLYPAGYAARGIDIDARLTLPPGWRAACAIAHTAAGDDTIAFDQVALDTLVDSPVLAGRHLRSYPLSNRVSLNVAGDEPHLVDATAEQLAPHAALVEEAVLLFGSRPFDRFEMLLALSDTLGTAGIEHHRSFEAVSVPSYFTHWDDHAVRRDTIPHEFVHSWNGKHRRGADACSSSFDTPIHNSLLWVYEGQTQYWTNVLCARSGLWSSEQALGALAVTAARYQARPGSRWRPLSDTTRDPIIAARSPLPWPSWQRSEDYYGEGALLWLDVDTRLRELSHDACSLDNFATRFFGGTDGDWSTRPYELDDVVRQLDELAAFDWRGFLDHALHDTRAGTLLDGVERAGYTLAFAEQPGAYQRQQEAETGSIDLTYSLGMTVAGDGRITDVLWGGAAFDAGLTIGTTIGAIAGRDFSPERLKEAVDRSGDAALDLMVRRGSMLRTLALPARGRARYPELVRRAGTPDRLGAILRPRRG